MCVITQMDPSLGLIEARYDLVEACVHLSLDLSPAQADEMIFRELAQVGARRTPEGVRCFCPEAPLIPLPRELTNSQVSRVLTLH